ncbi:CD2 antigen cytoplasmic tail-binding protein 2 isoform X1 [Sesbania bispinosa]|nr:CD2 antigen cytoplasmic tail-binding protein 2 isoform X1 [Sesbania bispinosa]
MAGESSRSSGKRPFVEDDDEFNKKPPAKRVRFPKGKKVKPGEEIVDKGNVEEVVNDLMNPRIAAKAAKERAKHRSQITAELLSEETGVVLNDTSAAEVIYEDNENFVDDGIQIEPFNLNKEREEGYFDADGNFVEYVRDNELKDAWLDNVEVDPRYSALSSVAINDKEEVQDLSSKDIGIMKRRIANILEPGETVLQCLRRLKGNGDRKAKMSAETKVVFDQLTEDAMKLMENGEYNVYHEKKEVFEREAEGYEKLARAKGDGTSLHSGEGNSSMNREENLLSDGPDSGVTSATFLTPAMDTSNLHLASAEASGNGAEDYDMFADDDEQATTKPSTDENNAVSQPSSDTINSGGALQNDYVYDESSGYYYSSSLGYYYDPNTGLYCSAASGQWYSFNEETGTYDEVQENASNVVM